MKPKKPKPLPPGKRTRPTSRKSDIKPGTAEDVARQILAAGASRVAVSETGYTVGCWSQEAGRFIIVASRMVGDAHNWYRAPDLLVNGRPLLEPHQWKEVR